jgi:hypothetical protein
VLFLDLFLLHRTPNGQLTWHICIVSFAGSPGSRQTAGQVPLNEPLIPCPRQDWHSRSGGILVDWLLGIEVGWAYDGYTDVTQVDMHIIEPLASLPTVEQTTCRILSC